MPKTESKLTPGDHGRRMTREEFDRSERQPGFRYELNNGVLYVSPIPVGKPTKINPDQDLAVYFQTPAPR
jgi:hypothetical protein